MLDAVYGDAAVAVSVGLQFGYVLFALFERLLCIGTSAAAACVRLGMQPLHVQLHHNTGSSCIQ